MIDTAYKILYVVAMSALAFCILFILIRAIRGPRLTDRIVCSNMAGTVIIMIIAILSQWIKEGYLADICIIYASISFVAVVVLYRVYTNRYRIVDVDKLEPVNDKKELEIKAEHEVTKR